MQTRPLLIIVILAIGGCFTSRSWAACDESFQIHAEQRGESAAHEVLFKELAQGGKLGKLIRVQVGMDVCGMKGKSSAISKVREARFTQVVDRRLKEHPIGLAQYADGKVTTESSDSLNSAQAIEFTAFLSTAQALELGYTLGYNEMFMATAEISKTQKAALCKSYNNLANKILSGDR